MHIHYFVLRKIAHHVHEAVAGGIFAEAFTQEKDQVVLGLGSPSQDLWLRVSCGAPLPFVWPMSQFNKARKNVRTIFRQIEGLRIERVHCLPYERVILIDLEQDYQLALKMHGLMSNVLLLQGGKVVDRFRQHSEADLEFLPVAGQYDEAAVTAPHLQDLSVADHLKAISPSFEKHFVAYVERKMAAGMDFVQAFRECIAAATDDRYYLLRRPDRIQFLLFPVADADPSPADSTTHLPLAANPLPLHGLLPALNTFFRTYHQYQGYARLYESIHRPLSKHLGRLQGQIDSSFTSLDTLTHERPPEEIGHILMAHLHQIPAGEKEVELMDLYQGQPIRIKLKPELNPQQNAEQYYQKQKKHRSRAKHLEEQILRLEEELGLFKKILEGFAHFPPPQSLVLSSDGLDHSLLKRMNAFATENLSVLESGKVTAQPQKHGFMEFTKEGYTILVGKSAKQNDALTFAYSKKDDLWLHARDTTGSHVIICNPSLGPIPNPVLEYAAALAAQFSKRKHESLVPVQYTERKYVRKVKNGSPGQVLVEREKVVMVEPSREVKG
jgi:predicted ribosome quality control (RQC) complex YloA/Tae2 family protein